MRRKKRKAKITPAMAEALRQKRRSLGLTQAKIEHALDLPTCTMSEVERCNPRETVTMVSFNRICEYLSVSREELRKGGVKITPAQGSLDFTSAIRNPNIAFRPASLAGQPQASQSEETEVREILKALMPVIQEIPRFASMSIVQKMKASS